MSERREIEIGLRMHLAKKFVGEKVNEATAFRIKAEIKTWFKENHPELIGEVEDFFENLDWGGSGGGSK